MENSSSGDKKFSIKNLLIYRLIRWLFYSLSYLVVYTIYVVTGIVMWGIGFFLAAAEIVMIVVYHKQIRAAMSVVMNFLGGSTYAWAGVWIVTIILVPISIAIIYNLPLLPHGITFEGFENFTTKLIMLRDKPAREREAKKKIEEEMAWDSWINEKTQEYYKSYGEEKEGNKGEKKENSYAPSSGNNFSEVQSAMLLFRLHEGFTLDELKKAKREVIKLYHSDNTMNAQDDDKMKEINAKFELLKKLAK